MATVLERPAIARNNPKRFPRLTKADILGTRGLASGYYEITPDLATWILERRNPTNRRLAPQKVEALESDMICGRFMLNGESIIFDSDGNVMDAQHRLTGCVRSGVPFISLVAFGIEPAARVTIDQGRVRTTGDILAIEGHQYANVSASIAKLIIAFERGDGTKFTRLNMSRGAILAFVNNRPDITDIARFADKYQARRVLRATIAGFCYWLIGSRYGVEVAEEYLSKVSTGEGLKLGDGALGARNRLIAETNNQPATRVEIILRGFVYHYTGKHCGRIQVMGTFPRLPPLLAAA